LQLGAINIEQSCQEIKGAEHFTYKTMKNSLSRTVRRVCFRPPPS
jgi:hypothetical protein